MGAFALTGRFYFNAPAQTASPTSTAPPVPVLPSEAERAWGAAKDTTAFWRSKHFFAGSATPTTAILPRFDWPTKQVK